MVLVHGWAMHCGVWQDFAENLERTRRVICPDLPGHGGQPMTADFSLESLAEWLARQVTGPAHWLGWSLGVPLVLELARRYPERVASLVLMAGNARFVSGGDWEYGMEAAVFEAFAADLGRDREATLGRFLALMASGSGRRWSRLLAQRMGVRPAADPRALEAGLEILRCADMRSFLPDLAVPGLLILGEADALVPVSAGEAMRRLWPGARLCVIPRCGHIPFLSHPQAVAVCLLPFLEEVGGVY